jgi:hypothetical protein
MLVGFTFKLLKLGKSRGMVFSDENSRLERTVDELCFRMGRDIAQLMGVSTILIFSAYPA